MLHPSLIFVFLTSCHALDRTEVQNRTSNRPSNEGETVTGYLDSEQRTIEPDAAVIARIGNTEVEFQSGSVKSQAQVRLRRLKDLPALSADEAVEVGAVAGDIVHLEVYDAVSNAFLSSEELLLEYEFRQVVQANSDDSKFGLFVITDPGTDREQRALIDPDDIDVEPVSSLALNTQRFKISVALKLTSAIVWPVEKNADTPTKIMTKRANQTVSTGTGSVGDGGSGDSGGSSGDSDQPEPMYLAPMTQSVSLGYDHACAIISGSRVKCWGNNNSGTLGFPQESNSLVGDEPGELAASAFVPLGTGYSAVDIAGTFSTCVLFQTGQVKCWGNTASILGIGQSGSRTNSAAEMGENLPFVDLGTGRSAKQLSGNTNYTCAVLDNGTVKCWGCPPGHSNTCIWDSDIFGENPNEMGDNLPAIQLPDGGKIIQIVAGANNYACLLSDDGKVWCFGNNSTSVLGIPDGQVSYTPVSTLGSRMRAVDLGTNIRAIKISAGGANVCAILEDRQLKCWGSAQNGLMGRPYTDYYIGNSAEQMGDNLLPIDLGSQFKVADVVISTYSICAASVDGDVKCWGSNQFGQLGTGNGANEKIGDQDGEMGDNLAAVPFGVGRKVRQLFGQSSSAFCANLDDGSVKCWGANSNGKLGLGDSVMRGTQPNQMGDHLPALVFE